MARKSTGKRLRFEVFKRDGFTCRYCGAQPPDVVLVCDHLIPVVDGGETLIENLVTACETCNQGKAHKQISSIVPTPDADAMYLEVQQEIAELRRYQEAIAEREAELASLVGSIKDACIQASGDDLDFALIRSLLARYEAPVVYDACIAFVCSHRNKNWPYQLESYLFGICKNKHAERYE